MFSSLCENTGSGDSSVEGLIPKKVHFRDKDDNGDSEMLAGLSAEQTTSWIQLEIV